MTSANAQGLPLEVVTSEVRAKLDTEHNQLQPGRARRLALIPLVAILLLALAAGQQHFRPGAIAESAEPLAVQPNQVIALGRLIPLGEVRAISAPYGATDARLEKLLVEEGAQVSAGTPLAILDNHAARQAALFAADQRVAERQAELVQVRRTVLTAMGQAAALLAKAEVGAKSAEADLQRWTALLEQGFVSPASLDQYRAKRDEAAEELRRARVALARFSPGQSGQPDVEVAARSLDAAVADRAKALRDLEAASVLAPTDGTVLKIHVRPGERPGSRGILDFGATQHMAAELELYQADAGKVVPGQTVSLHSVALPRPLTGTIKAVGLSVGRQRIVDDSPAANLDARVVLAKVELDAPSSAVAARFVGLEVQATVSIKER